jgi:serine/threonine protein kinase
MAEEDQLILEVDPREIKYLSVIGEGTTAVVHLARFNGAQVAVKEIRASAECAECDEGTLQAVEREIGTLSQVKHENIVGFIGITIAALPIRLVLEYCAGGSLFELLHNKYNITLRWKQRLKMLSDVASALDYLHNFEPPILHRDLKSLNMMLLDQVTNEFDNVVVKLGDFGFARILEERSMTRGVGTKHWMAPEVLAGTNYTEKADIFSFAMAAFEVICRQVPFEVLDPTSVAQAISRGERPEWPDPQDVMPNMPEGLLSMVESCWAQSPGDRPNIGQIKDDIERLRQIVQEAFRL